MARQALEVGTPRPVTVAQAAGSANGRAAPTMPLSRFQRMLLASDGTVTLLLEAFTREPIVVAKLAQTVTSSQACHEVLDLGGHAEVMERTVLLVGATSGRNYVHARSLIATGRLDPGLAHDLTHTDHPIGALLRKHRAETAKELLAWGRERAGAYCSYFGIEATEPLVWRRYRVISDGRPIMAITERFAAVNESAFADPRPGHPALVGTHARTTTQLKRNCPS